MTSVQRRRGLTCDMVSLPSARLTDLSALLDFVDAFCEQAGIDSDDHFDLRADVHAGGNVQEVHAGCGRSGQLL